MTNAVNLRSIFIACLIITTVFSVAISAAYGQTPDKITATRVIEATNRFRGESGLAPLELNPKLSQSAQEKAQDMADNSYFAHADSSGRRLAYWLGKVDYRYHFAGENLAYGFTTTRSLLRAWKNSPTHYANIIKPEYTDIGIGIAKGTYNGRPVLFVAQHFGSQYPKK